MLIVRAEQKNQFPGPGPEPGPGLDPAVLDPDPVRPGRGPVPKFRTRLQPVLVPGPENLEPEPVPVPDYPVHIKKKLKYIFAKCKVAICKP